MADNIKFITEDGFDIYTDHKVEADEDSQILGQGFMVGNDGTEAATKATETIMKKIEELSSERANILQDFCAELLVRTMLGEHLILLEQQICGKNGTIKYQYTWEKGDIPYNPYERGKFDGQI